MKIFKDISFKEHERGKGHIQGLLMLDNGIELSVVAGTQICSAGKTGVRAAVDNPEDVSLFEVAIFDKDGKIMGSAVDNNDMVLAFQSREDINKLIKYFS